MDLEKELEKLVETLKQTEDPITTERVSLQLKAMELLLKVRIRKDAAKGVSEEDDEHPAVWAARTEP